MIMKCKVKRQVHVFVKGTGPLPDQWFMVHDGSNLEKIRTKYNLLATLPARTCIRLKFGSRVLHSNDEDETTIEGIGIQGILDFLTGQTVACTINAFVVSLVSRRPEVIFKTKAINETHSMLVKPTDTNECIWLT